MKGFRRSSGSRSPASRGTRGRRPPRLLPVLLLGLLVVLAPPRAAAQDDGARAPGAGQLSAQAEPSAGQAMVEDGAASVLPRSERPYHHVFLAFAIAWVLMLAFVMVLARRMSAVERDLERLGVSRP